MNRLLSVCHHPALVCAARRRLLKSTASANFKNSVFAVSSLLHSAWFSTSSTTSQQTPSVPEQYSLQPHKGRRGFTSVAPSVSQPNPSSSPQPSSSAPGAAPAPASPSPSPGARTGAGIGVHGSDVTAANAAAQPAAAGAEAEVGYVDVQPGARAAPTLLQVVPTPEGAPRDKLLVRDFIQNSLYHPTLGYFNLPTPPVGSMGGPINYWKIYCKDEFNIIVRNKYQELETSFLTPAELFSPWYGACVARHMVEHRRHYLGTEGQPLNIVEVGGGNGTLARDILDWLRDNRPQDYAMTSYTCLEISTSLAARQYDKVVRQGGHRGRFHLARGSGLDPATWAAAAKSGAGGRVWEHTFVLMMEVLDNLPHDRVFRRRASDPWQQSVVRPAAPAASSPSTSPSSASPSMEGGPWVEAGEPLSDPLVSRTLGAVYRAPTREAQLDDKFNRVLDFILARDAQPTSREEVLWLPTACLAFLELLHDVRPNHSLIAADFDRLPDVRLPGRNAPLVAQKVGGRNIDHDTLLVPWGTADIFFPTDFEALCDLYRAAAEHVWGPEGTATTAATAPAAAVNGGSAGSVTMAPAAASPAAAAPPPASPPVSNVGDVNAEHFRQGAVMKRYREMFNTATICAFNPMVDDFVNARFFFGDSKNRFPPGKERPKQTKLRLPHGAAAPGSGIRSHIPAASASTVRQRFQPPGPPPPPGQGRGHGQGQGQAGGATTEPMLGGKRQRPQLAGGSSGGKGRGPQRS